jgi:uncharacterized membrane protein YfcA
MTTDDMVVLLAMALAAGWVDAVVGGGGLLLLPTLLLMCPGMSVPMALGTSKLTAFVGTASAAVTYARDTDIRWRIAGPGMPLAMLCSAGGALLAAMVPAGVFKPVVLGVLVAVALFVMLRPRFGAATELDRSTPARAVAAVAVGGGLIACYDGMIGPGTGIFLILAFTAIAGVDFIQASAIAKLVNVATNLGALAVFASGGFVWWRVGVAMAVCNMVGAVLGARTAVRRGAGFVRTVLVVVVLALVARLGYDLWRG